MGRAKVSPDQFSPIHLDGFNRPVDRIRLHANGQVDCNTIQLDYRDGEIQQLFGWTLSGGGDRVIALPDRRYVEGISLDCRADNGKGTQVAVAADVPAPDGGVRTNNQPVTIAPSPGR